jgi:hypothetical protein
MVIVESMIVIFLLDFDSKLLFYLSRQSKDGLSEREHCVV